MWMHARKARMQVSKLPWPLHWFHITLPPFPLYSSLHFPLLLQKLELPWSEASKQPCTLPLPVWVINPAGQFIPFKPFTLSFELAGWSLHQSKGCWPFLPLSIPPGVQDFPGARHSPPKHYQDMTRLSQPPSRARPQTKAAWALHPGQSPLSGLETAWKDERASRTDLFTSCYLVPTPLSFSEAGSSFFPWSLGLTSLSSSRKKECEECTCLRGDYFPQGQAEMDNEVKHNRHPFLKDSKERQLDIVH